MKNNNGKKLNLKKIIKLLQKYKLQLIIIILAIIVILQFISSGKTTFLEKKYIENKSNSIMPYIANIEKSTDKDLDKYIIYAVEYNYNENNQKNVSLKTVVDTINNIFNKKVTEEKIIKVGITPSMIDAHIGYDSEKNEFVSYVDRKTYNDIAETKINIYIIDTIKKCNDSKFKVAYKKYIVNNPYDILNYYDSQNNLLKKDRRQNKTVDTTDMLDYLTGKGNLKTIQKYFKADEVKEFAKAKGKVVVTYTYENEILKINEISTK